MTNSNDDYLQIFCDAIGVCANYKPKLGDRSRNEGFSLSEFQQLYQSDPLYSWMGLDHPSVYAAHKVASGMTRLYRKIGTGCENVFRRVLQDSLGLNDDDVRWSYQVPSDGGRKSTIHLDGRILIDKVKDKCRRDRIKEWMRCSAKRSKIDEGKIEGLIGIVFEVRQGYKSADSKRQKADITNASKAIENCLLPCLLVMSEQVDEQVIDRYRKNHWTVLTGSVGTNDPANSTYDFIRDIIGYDLEDFFRQNSDKLKSEVDKILQSLLTERSK